MSDSSGWSLKWNLDSCSNSADCWSSRVEMTEDFVNLWNSATQTSTETPRRKAYLSDNLRRACSVPVCHCGVWSIARLASHRRSPWESAVEGGVPLAVRRCHLSSPSFATTAATVITDVGNTLQEYGILESFQMLTSYRGHRPLVVPYCYCWSKLNLSNIPLGRRSKEISFGFKECNQEKRFLVRVISAFNEATSKSTGMSATSVY